MSQLNQALDQLVKRLNSIILGKDGEVRQAVACLLAGGHLLLEDLPGMGKTTLAEALATCMGLSFNRVQFTSDMLPADIIGAQIYEPDKRQFRFHPGPVFTQVLLADELNRATPKAQSALLQSMEEQKVSMEGEDHPLPNPFFVIATQNPSEQSGTYPLPESQLDRFLIRISLGYPDPKAERELLKGNHGRASLASQKPILNSAAVLKVRSLIPKISLSDAVLDYIQRLVAATRDPAVTSVGLSPRGAQSLVKASQAWALLHARNYVLPEDIQAVFLSVAAHRLVVKQGSGQSAAQQILSDTQVIQ